VYDDVPESSTRHHGTFHPPVSPPSPPVPPVSLKQLLALLNAIVQRLVAIDEWRAVQSQPHQQHQESSYFDFLATQPLEFAETTDQANHWLRVTESKFRLLHCSELQKTLFIAQQLCGPQLPGGPCILPLFRIITKCRGVSSARHSASATFQQESRVTSYRNSCIYGKGPTV
jgi:hypothetical protein